MPEALAIRLAKPEDAEAIADLAVRSFRDTFTAGAEPADMEAYVRDVLSAEQFYQDLLSSTNTFLALFSGNSDVPLGYAKLRSGTTEPCITDANSVELERLYVDTAVIGKGLGSRLMQASLDKARELGFSGIWLGVWENNERAIAFYKRWHFQTVGSHVFVLGSDEQTDLIMMRSL